MLTKSGGVTALKSLFIAWAIAQFSVTILVIFVPVLDGKYTIDSAGLYTVVLISILYAPTFFALRRWQRRRSTLK
jgi:hypothetical protein